MAYELCTFCLNCSIKEEWFAVWRQDLSDVRLLNKLQLVAL